MTEKQEAAKDDAPTGSSPFTQAVRRAAAAGVWSSGVRLARAGAVATESRDDDEVVLRVRSPGRPVAPTVVLYPGELDWDCDCPARVRPCEHIVAGALSLEQADAGGGELRTASELWTRIAYRFARADGGLTVSRAVIRQRPDDGGVDELPLDVSLEVLRVRPEGRDLHLEEQDLRADLLLASNPRGVLAPSTLDALLTILKGARHATLDGRPIAIAEEIVRPRAVVADAGDGLTVTITRDPRVTDVVSPGVAVAGDALARLGETDLTGVFLEHLPRVTEYPARAVAELATKILPDLASRMVVDVRSRRVPPVSRELEPRILLTLNQVEDGVTVLPTLVYGHPASVRIDEGRMTHLGGPVPIRDVPAERDWIQRLRDQLGLLPGRRATFSGPDTARFVDKLRRWRGDVTGDGARAIGRRVELIPELRVMAGANAAGAGAATGGPGAPDVRFAFAFRVKGDAGAGGPGGDATTTVDAGTVLRAWQDGLGLVPLGGGGWAELPRDFLTKNGQRLADLLAARAADGRVAPHALAALGTLCGELEQPPPPGLDRLATLAAGFAGIPPAKLPDDLNATLRPYQRQGVDWLAFLRDGGMGAILADDMGLGKTLQAIAALRGPALVVCPTSVLPNWRAELARFRPGLKVSLYHGPGRQLDTTADVTLTSYALLRLDQERLCARRFATVILDEAQAIKNPDSQVARAAYALDADFRVVLTGTPVENRLEELWSLAHFTNRGLLGGRREFDDRFARPIADGDSTAASALRERLRPFVLRRMKREVAPELPPRTDAVVRVALDERERGIYDAVRAATRAEIVSLIDGGGSVLAALEGLLRLRQAACHPALVPGQRATTSSKLDALVEALTNAAADGHKALVFSQWTSLLDLIEPALGANELSFCRLDGSTRDRGAVVEQFQSESGPPVMLLSLTAGGVGLNLTAADHVFLFDPWWNPATEDQAADRAHRIGQQRPVVVYRLVAADTVEERILALQEKKRALADTALADGAGAAGLTREDLLALLD